MPPRDVGRGNPAFLRLCDVLPGGFHGRIDAPPPSGGDALAVEYGQGHWDAVTLSTTLAAGKPDCTRRQRPSPGLGEADAVTGVSREESVSAPA